MGAWGYEPFDNDAALDWLGPIEKRIAEHIRHALRSKVPDTFEQIAAAQLLLDLTARGKTHVSISYEASRLGLYDLALKAVDIARADNEAIAQWRKPQEYAAQLASLRRRLLWRRRSEAARMKKIVIRVHRKRKAAAAQSKA